MEHSRVVYATVERFESPSFSSSQHAPTVPMTPSTSHQLLPVRIIGTIWSECCCIPSTVFCWRGLNQNCELGTDKLVQEGK